jgi:hypothetical protein
MKSGTSASDYVLDWRPGVRRERGPPIYLSRRHKMRTDCQSQDCESMGLTVPAELLARADEVIE